MMRVEVCSDDNHQYEHGADVKRFHIKGNSPIAAVAAMAMIASGQLGM